MNNGFKLPNFGQTHKITRSSVNAKQDEFEENHTPGHIMVKLLKANDKKVKGSLRNDTLNTKEQLEGLFP